MKLTASGVANWAAITRSPSFSRSGVVDDDDELAVADVVDRLVDRRERGRAGHRSHRSMLAAGHEPLDVFCEDVDLEVDRVAGRQRAEGRHRERVRDQRDREARRRRAPRPSASSPRPRSSPSRRSSAGAPAPRRTRSGRPGSRRTVPTPSTWPWTTWPPIGVAGTQRRLEVDARPGLEPAERGASRASPGPRRTRAGRRRPRRRSGRRRRPRPSLRAGRPAPSREPRRRAARRPRRRRPRRRGPARARCR